MTGSRFFTLTFNNTNQFRLDDIEKCNYEFKKFIQRLKGFNSDFKYLAVPEFQKRGALHYHLVINIPFIEQKLLAHIWRMGFVFIQAISDTPNIAAYLTKYLRKNGTDERFYGKKTYFVSRGLIQPIILYGDEAIRILKRTSKEQIYKSVFDSFYLGEVQYTHFKILSSGKHHDD